MSIRPVTVLGALLLAGARAERCVSSALVLHCQSRCAGVNATSFASSSPSEDLLRTEDAGAERQRPRWGGGSPLVFAQLEETETPQQGGSPTAPTRPNAANFTDQTVYAPAHRALSPDELLSIVGPASAVEWVPVRSAGFGCVDGRQADAGLHAYGGDFGEFALALTVYEHMAQRQLTQAETTRLLGGWVGQLREAGAPFRMCVDAQAVAQLAASVGAPDLDLSAPPEESRSALMLRVSAPEFVGSEHVKWMLQYPQTYAVRRELVEQLLRSFYGALWNEYHPLHSSLRLDVIGGVRAERAVVHVHANHWCSNEQGLAPAVSPKTRAGSAFFYSPDAVAQRRTTVSAYMGRAASPTVDPKEYGERLRTLGEGQAKLTEKALAGMLRSYSMMLK